MDKGMSITFDTRSAAAIVTEALVSYVFEPEKDGVKPIDGVVEEPSIDPQRAPSAFGGRRRINRQEVPEATLLHFVPGLAAQRVLLIGAGKRDKFGSAELRRLAAVAARFLKARSIKKS